MKRIFRTSAKYWAQEEGFALVLWVSCILVSLWWGLALFIGLGILMLLITLPGAYRRLLSRLEIDGECIACFEKSDQISIKWSRVLFIQLLKSYRRPMRIVRFGVSNATGQPSTAPDRETGEKGRDWFQVEIPIDHFDHKEIWRLIQEYAPPAALEEDAYRKVPGYSLLLDQVKHTLSEKGTPLKVSMSWFVRITYWTVMLTTAVCAVILRDSVFGVSILVFFFLLGLWGVIETGKIEVDHETISYRAPIGNYQIRWDEITRIETDLYGAMVFYGADKHLAIYGPGWWSGKDKEDLVEFLFLKIELNEIRIENKRILFKVARNTRIK